MIDTVSNAEKVLESGVDAVFLGRPLLRDPYLPLRGTTGDARPQDAWPVQYHRAL
ncbi:MAG: hypothetical protein GEV11_27735 [Streptosporangiales bacterium]|nr:hypothetical protein [Streptosporangiales bacterium]